MNRTEDETESLCFFILAFLFLYEVVFFSEVVSFLVSFVSSIGVRSVMYFFRGITVEA